MENLWDFSTCFILFLLISAWLLVLLIMSALAQDVSESASIVSCLIVKHSSCPLNQRRWFSFTPVKPSWAHGNMLMALFSVCLTPVVVNLRFIFQWSLCNFPFPFSQLSTKAEGTTDVTTKSTSLFSFVFYPASLLAMPWWWVFQYNPWNSMKSCMLILFISSCHSWCFPVI